jgi:hypothetical protein
MNLASVHKRPKASVGRKRSIRPLPGALYKRPGCCLALLKQVSANMTHVEFHPAGGEGAGSFCVIYVFVNKDSLPLKGTL